MVPEWRDPAELSRRKRRTSCSSRPLGRSILAKRHLAALGPLSPPPLCSPVSPVNCDRRSHLVLLLWREAPIDRPEAEKAIIFFFFVVLDVLTKSLSVVPGPQPRPPPAPADMRILAGGQTGVGNWILEKREIIMYVRVRITYFISDSRPS